MKNLFSKKISKEQTGAATLIITTIMLVSITMIAFFAANYSITHNKSIANATNYSQAYEAAEAGLEFGINYLNQNSAAILASPVGGFLAPYSNSQTTNVALANGSKFTVTYSNPTANNYNVIRVTSTGQNSDNTATNTVTQLVRSGSLLYVLPTNPLIVKGSAALSSSSQIQNTSGNTNITSGLSTTLTGSAQTLLSTGVSSTASYTGSDIQQNIGSLASKSTGDLFSTYFGVGTSNAKNKANFTYSNIFFYNSVLNGKAATTIWIDQTSGNAYVYSNTQVGTTANPVLLIVNGNLNLSEQAKITGFVVTLGTSSMKDQSQIDGGLLSIGNINLSDSASILFDPTVLRTLQRVTNSYYAKVPGSWRDF